MLPERSVFFSCWSSYNQVLCLFEKIASAGLDTFEALTMLSKMGVVLAGYIRVSIGVRAVDCAAGCQGTDKSPVP